MPTVEAGCLYSRIAEKRSCRKLGRVEEKKGVKLNPVIGFPRRPV
jgi:hypothetical protein